MACSSRVNPTTCRRSTSRVTTPTTRRPCLVAPTDEPERPGGLPWDSSSRRPAKCVMLALQSPSVHLIGIRLHNRHNETVGVLVLLLADSGAQADPKAAPRPDRLHPGGLRRCGRQHRKPAPAAQAKTAAGRLHPVARRCDQAKSPYTGGYRQRVPALYAGSPWGHISTDSQRGKEEARPGFRGSACSITFLTSPCCSASAGSASPGAATYT